jgi:membrane protease YdiL (CAAX protease family)
LETAVGRIYRQSRPDPEGVLGPLQQNRPQPVFSRTFQLALFLTGFLWAIAAGSIAARAAQGIVNRLNLAILDKLLQQIFFVFLLLWGFATLRWISTRAADVRSTNALPKRPTTLQEWLRGAALGWAMLIAAILPMMLSGALHPEFSLAPRNWGLALLSLATIAFTTLALELAFRGFLFARLIDATGPILATIFLSLFYAVVSSNRPNASSLSFIVTFFLGVVFSIAYLQTHALWLGWGLHFAWNAAMAVLFGLPIAGLATDSNLVTTSVTGPDSLTGGAYGPEAAVFTLIVLFAAIIVLYRITRHYAWEYTHPPIVAAGYPMDIAPPAAHTAMEAAAEAPTPLVQILSTTPTTSSTHPVIEEHLRRDTDPTPHD